MRTELELQSAGKCDDQLGSCHPKTIRKRGKSLYLYIFHIMAYSLEKGNDTGVLDRRKDGGSKQSPCSQTKREERNDRIICPYMRFQSIKQLKRFISVRGLSAV